MAGARNGLQIAGMRRRHNRAGCTPARSAQTITRRKRIIHDEWRVDRGEYRQTAGASAEGLGVNTDSAFEPYRYEHLPRNERNGLAL